jgi:hypothetical protein
MKIKISLKRSPFYQPKGEKSREFPSTGGRAGRGVKKIA